MADASVIAALERAVVEQPRDCGLRVHLASLLVMAGDPARALEHAQRALAIEPDRPEALAAARDAARATRDSGLAERYDRILGVAADAGEPPASQLSDPVPVESEFVEDGEPDESLEEGERPRVTLADVGGLTEVKERLNTAFLAPLRDPELRRYYGKSLRGGLLLYGPPGCGKTFLARAVAGELGARFFAIGLNDVLDMWLGESERHLHDLFEAARRAAPCVLFLDEVDALGRKRSQLRYSAGRNVVNQLLAELDGAASDNEGVFVLAATNHPWDVDTALRRPGRLDRTVLVLPPDTPAREAILARALDERPVEGVDVARLVRDTDEYSGADVVHLVEVAAEQAIADSVRTGQHRPIAAADFDNARSSIKPSTRAWFSLARNYAMYANDAGEYDDLLTYIRTHKIR